MSRTRWRQPVRLGDAIAAAIQRTGLGPRFRQHEIWRVWPGVVGAQIARHAQPHAVRHGRLVVHVTDPVWLHHLSMMRHRLTAALNEKVGASLVREMILKVGEVRGIAPESSPGKAAPDPADRPDPELLARIENLLVPLRDAPFRDALYRLLLRGYRPAKS